MAANNGKLLQNVSIKTTFIQIFSNCLNQYYTPSNINFDGQDSLAGLKQIYTRKRMFGKDDKKDLKSL